MANTSAMYTLSAPPYEFASQVSTTTLNGVPTGYTVRVGIDPTSVTGHRDDACVVIVLAAPNHPDERWRAYIAPKLHVATLERVQFDETCSLNQAMQRGRGTVHMVLAAVRFVVQAFPWITHFQLTDNSTVECIGGDEDAADHAGPPYVVSLTALSLCTTGMTWYERAFRAKLALGHPEYRAMVDASPLMDPGRKPSTADAFFDTFGVPRWVRPITSAALQTSLTGRRSAAQARMDDDADIDLHAIIRRVYDARPTLQGMFAELKGATARDARAPFCHLVFGWVDEMFKRMFDPKTYSSLRVDRWVFRAADLPLPTLRVTASGAPIQARGGARPGAVTGRRLRVRATAAAAFVRKRHPATST